MNSVNVANARNIRRVCRFASFVVLHLATSVCHTQRTDDFEIFFHTNVILTDEIKF